MGLPRRLAKNAIIKTPDATDYEIAKKTGVSPRTVASARADLIVEGVLQPNRRVPEPTKIEISQKIDEIKPAEATDQPLTEESEKQMLGGKTLREIVDVEVDEDLENDEETRKKLLRIIKNIAFNQRTHPDTRITAIQAWTKLRDIARTKELGPGLPLSEEDVLNRLTRIYRAVGPKLAIKALEMTFQIEKDSNASQTSNQQDSTPIGTTEAPIEAGYESSPSQT